MRVATTNALRVKRVEKGMTQEELAEQAEVSRLTIFNIENEKIKRPADETMLKIANALNVSVNDIFFTPLVKHVFQSKTNDTN